MVLPKQPYLQILRERPEGGGPSSLLLMLVGEVRELEKWKTAKVSGLRKKLRTVPI